MKNEREQEKEGITKKVVGAVRRRAQQSECRPGLSAASSSRQVGRTPSRAVQALERQAVRCRRDEFRQFGHCCGKGKWIGDA